MGWAKRTRTWCAPSRHCEPARLAGAFPLPRDPHGITLSFGALPNTVAAIRFAAPASPFPRPRGLSMIDLHHRGDAFSPGLGLPFRVSRPDPAGVLRDSDNLHGVSRPYSDFRAEVHIPGIPAPVRSAFRVFHPLDGLLPPAHPDLEDRYRSWGSPFRAFPPPRAVRVSAPVPSCRF